MSKGHTPVVAILLNKIIHINRHNSLSEILNIDIDVYSVSGEDVIGKVNV